MSPTTRIAALRSFARALLLDESGQSVTEYSVTTGALLLGGTASLFVFLPNAINAYRDYVKGFYLLLGLPIP